MVKNGSNSVGGYIANQSSHSVWAIKKEGTELTECMAFDYHLSSDTYRNGTGTMPYNSWGKASVNDNDVQDSFEITLQFQTAWYPNNISSMRWCIKLISYVCTIVTKCVVRWMDITSSFCAESRSSLQVKSIAAVVPHKYKLLLVFTK